MLKTKVRFFSKHKHVPMYTKTKIEPFDSTKRKKISEKVKEEEERNQIKHCYSSSSLHQIYYFV